MKINNAFDEQGFPSKLKSTLRDNRALTGQQPLPYNKLAILSGRVPVCSFTAIVSSGTNSSAYNYAIFSVVCKARIPAINPAPF